MPKKFLPLLGLPFLILFLNLICFAENPPSSQQMGGQERARELQKQQEKLQNQVEQPKTKAKTEEKAPEETAPQVTSETKVLIKGIKVTGVTLFTDGQIRALTNQYENKELTLKEIQGIAVHITDLYRKKGYITSRAYIPPQKMGEGVLEVKVIEAKVGDISVTGNRFYSTKLLESYLTLEKGEPFNYNDLKQDLVNINEHPDRNVKAVLTPGKDPNSTDVVLNEKDSLPIHMELGYNNFLSRFLRRNIYSTTVTDNNLLGRDDILTVQYQRGDANDYYSYSGNYLYHVTNGLDLGVYASRSNEVLGKEFTEVDARGKSRMFGFYGSQKLIKNDNLTSNLNFGFDYKDVYNFLNGNISSQDRLRIAKVGLDFDLADDLGRTVINDDFNYGIPGIMGGTKKNLDPTDTPASRAGAGGQFTKDTLNMLRWQKLPFDSTLLWKNQLQFSPSKLTSTEQYQIGGPVNNRGYTPAEFVGDQGYSMSWELAEPLYSIPKTWKTPLSKTSVYDAFRVFEFYDWSTVHLNSLQPGDEKNRTLRSAGCGIKLNIMEGMYASYQIGWPLGLKPADGKSVHHWVELTKKF